MIVLIVVGEGLRRKYDADDHIGLRPERGGSTSNADSPRVADLGG
jgi:hypothetical protein